MSIEFSVVMPTYNRLDTLKVVLPTILAQTFPQDAYEVLLCDAGSTDGTKEYVESLNAPNLKLLVGPNRGRAGARNRGIDNAQGKIVLFTDADILASPTLLAEHAKYHQKYPNHGIVGCEVQVKSLEEYEEFRKAPQEHARHKRTREFIPWHYFLTGNASVPKDILVKVGKFDENFIGYGHEDLELGYRLLKHGYVIRYNPDAVDYHFHPVEFEENKGKYHLAGRSTVRFYRKYHDLRICLQMGMNPLSLGVHTLLSEHGTVMKWLNSLAPNSKTAREIILQYHYVSGIKEALRTK